jgi:peroxiredoxin
MSQAENVTETVQKTQMKYPYMGMPTVATSPLEVHPLIIGSKIPEGRVKTAEGNWFDVNAELARRPVIISFYCGSWCQVCDSHLDDLNKVESELNKLDYTVMAISPDRPDRLRDAMNRHNMRYLLLSDSTMNFARGFGIAFLAGKEMMDEFKKINIDIEAASNEKHHQLPVPSIFIVGTDGVIRFSYTNPDWKSKIDTNLLLAAAKAVRT